MNDIEHVLEVDRSDLLEGLMRFKIRRKIRSTERAVLGFDGRFFSIEALDWTVAVLDEIRLLDWVHIARDVSD